MSVFSRREPAVRVLAGGDQETPELVVDLRAAEPTDAGDSGAELTAQQMLGIAAELLRAQRDDDRHAFTAALNRAGGRTSDLLVSMAFLVNRCLDTGIGATGAAALIQDQALAQPQAKRREPRPDPEARWRDAVAMAEAMATGRSRDAELLLIDASDETALFRDFLRVFAAVAAAVPGESFESTIDQLRSSPPPAG